LHWRILLDEHHFCASAEGRRAFVCHVGQEAIDDVLPLILYHTSHAGGE